MTTDEQLHQKAARLHQREREWQPIETAPESSLVILFCDARGNRWTDCADNRHEMCGFPATHWMPLPQPPTATSGTGAIFFNEETGCSEEIATQAKPASEKENGDG